MPQRFVEENLNRLFSSGHSKDKGKGAGLINNERHRALLLEKTVTNFLIKGRESGFFMIYKPHSWLKK
ncbi:MAG TPA: hypothetical protein DE042_04275 [Colwellia sp.]|nr:hypothetical protein [Colwellia sp.]